AYRGPLAKPYLEFLKKALKSSEQGSSNEESYHNADCLYCSTIWFREMLDWEIQAFQTYLHLETILVRLEGKMLPEDIENKAFEKTSNFEKSIAKQIQVNKDYLYPNLVTQPLCYIKMQWGNIK